jgi:hypothetical protein
MKIYGANIFCNVCHAEPWPDDPAVRETFDLIRVKEGWRCEAHRSPGQRAARIAVTSAAALAELEQAIAGKADPAEIARALAALKKTIASRKPPVRPSEDAS